MAEEAAKAKRVRGAKLGVFTRKCTHALQLIENDAVDQFKDLQIEVRRIYADLERVHEEYVVLVEEAVMNEEGDYLGVHSASFIAIDSQISQKLQTEKEVVRVRDNTERTTRANGVAEADAKRKREDEEARTAVVQNEEKQRKAGECLSAKAAFLSNINMFGQPSNRI